MGHIVFMVEPASRSGGRWCIKGGGSTLASYASRAQAVVDARQLTPLAPKPGGAKIVLRQLPGPVR